MLKLKYLILIIMISGMNYVYSTTSIIQVGGFSFTPNAVTVNIGDTVKFMWMSGIHTTTSVSVPTGATAWSSPMDSAHTSFIYKVTDAGLYNFQCNYHYFMGMTGTITVNPTGIKPISNTVPDKFELLQNYPNPFNPTTNINFNISNHAVIKLVIYDLKGAEVVTLVKQEVQPGSYSVVWDASGYSSGLYLFRLEAPGFSQTRKMLVIK